MEELSLADARRIALAAQRLGPPRDAGSPGPDELVAAVGRLGLIQLDSVNVLCRSHYLPLFSRLGPYDRFELDRLTGHGDQADGAGNADGVADRTAGLPLVEYWAHQASLIPAGRHPLFRWRMARVDQELWGPVVKVARDQPDLVARALRMVQEQGPIPASAIGAVRQAGTTGGLWNFNAGKSALEYLFYAGRVAVSGRVDFERMYDAPERVLPASVLAARTSPMPTPSASSRASPRPRWGATEPDLGDYFRLPRAASKARVAELVAAGELVPVSVDGWKAPAYLWPEAADRPGLPARAGRPARALLSPFDSLIWFRDRTERLFGFRYHVEIYTPAAKRVHGYYVLPFLLGDALVARVDLKSDRRSDTLIVQAAYAEPGVDRAAVARELAAELSELTGWLGLGQVLVSDHGDLAGELAEAARQPQGRLAGAQIKPDFLERTVTGSLPLSVMSKAWPTGTERSSVGPGEIRSPATGSIPAAGTRTLTRYLVTAWPRGPARSRRTARTVRSFRRGPCSDARRGR